MAILGCATGVDASHSTDLVKSDAEKLNKINVRIYSISRLQQDFEAEIEDYGFYIPEPNLILVNNTNKDEVINTIIKIYEQCYFKELKPVSNLDLSQLKKVL